LRKYFRSKKTYKWKRLADISDLERLRYSAKERPRARPLDILDEIRYILMLSHEVMAKGSSMSTGTVKFFNESKGFGFIAPSDGGKDVFVHSSEVQNGPLYENDSVSFEIGDSPKGPRAVNVQKS